MSDTAERGAMSERAAEKPALPDVFDAINRRDIETVRAWYDHPRRCTASDAHEAVISYLLSSLSPVQAEQETERVWTIFQCEGSGGMTQTTTSSAPVQAEEPKRKCSCWIGRGDWGGNSEERERCAIHGVQAEEPKTPERTDQERQNLANLFAPRCELLPTPAASLGQAALKTPGPEFYYSERRQQYVRMPASPVREAEPFATYKELCQLNAASQQEVARLKAELSGLREAEPLKALVVEAVELLKHVRVLDCGAHYCRYCPAKSPEWEHTPSCPYEESQVVSERARVLRQKLSAALEGAATKGQGQ